MNWLTFGFGVFALTYGLFSIYVRLKCPEKFGKLEAMKQIYGQRPGAIMHTVSYTIIPIVVGIILDLLHKSLFPSGDHQQRLKSRQGS